MAGPILPTRTPARGPPDNWRARSKGLLTRRYARVLLFAIFTLSLIAVFLNGGSNLEEMPIPGVPSKPPVYAKYHERERHLPQHDLSLPAPEGKHAKYVYFSNHVHASGWGNVMQEMLLNAHLAYATKRAYVFDNYTWSRDMSSEYSEFNGKVIPARIPLTALISGPIIGESFGSGSDVPRAVSAEFYRKVCPEPTVLSSSEFKNTLGPWGDSDGAYNMEEWTKYLSTRPERCLEFVPDEVHLFDVWMFGSKHILSLFPILKESPILKQFGWSPLIVSAYKTNRAMFEHTGFFSWLFPSNSKPPYKALPGLIALHMRRGDFEEHCINLSDWGSRFNGFNSFPELPDRFEPDGLEGAERRTYYLERCYPDIDQIVEKVRGLREGRTLDRIYVMSNGNVEWLKELKQGLGKLGGWKSIKTSRDLTLTRDQRPVAQALDMFVASRAEVFVGNGFSSLTSNVIVMRMANDTPPETTRLW